MFHNIPTPFEILSETFIKLNLFTKVEFLFVKSYFNILCRPPIAIAKVFFDQVTKSSNFTTFIYHLELCDWNICYKSLG